MQKQVIRRASIKASSSSSSSRRVGVGVVVVVLIVVGLVVTAATVWCKKHGIFCTLVPTAA
jgi:hypothetical protein